MTWIEMVKEWLKSNKPKKHPNMELDISELGPSVSAKKSAKRGNSDTGDS